VGDAFWREWRKAVKETDPGALTVAETWFDSSKYLLGDMFDSTMNYIFRQAVLDYASGKKTGSQANAMLEMLRENYPPEAFHSLMNLLSTHDSARSLYVFGYRENGGPGYSGAVAKQKLAFLLQMTYPGAPAIYYGDEAGLTGGGDPDDRGPFPWKDKGGNPDTDLHDVVKRLVSLRTGNRILSRGSLETLYSDQNVVAWIRKHENKTALVILNNSDGNKEVTLNLEGTGMDGNMKDILNGVSVSEENGLLRISIDPLWGRVIE
jgi:cyclomaltodextrinase / maltogenic alpha-amylase / neopullulanase